MVGCALPGDPRPHHKSVFDFDEVINDNFTYFYLLFYIF